MMDGMGQQHSPETNALRCMSSFYTNDKSQQPRGGGGGIPGTWEEFIVQGQHRLMYGSFGQKYVCFIEEHDTAPSLGKIEM